MMWEQQQTTFAQLVVSGREVKRGVKIAHLVGRKRTQHKAIARRARLGVTRMRKVRWLALHVHRGARPIPGQREIAIYAQRIQSPKIRTKQHAKSAAREKALTAAEAAQSVLPCLVVFT